MSAGISNLLSQARPRAPVIPGAGQVPIPGLVAGVQRAFPGGATGMMACPQGHHPNKADYFLRDGTFVPEGSRCVKNRRRNPLNPRALRSAIGRVDAGKVWQQKLSGISTQKHTSAGKPKSCGCR